MSNQDYRKAYETAATELEATLKQQEKIESRVMSLRKTLNVLSELCQQAGIDTTDLDHRYARLLQVIESSLTDDIFRILKSSEQPLSAPEIRQELIKLGGSLADSTNPLATIHAIVNRLVESGRAKETLKDGRKAWERYMTLTERIDAFGRGTRPRGTSKIGGRVISNSIVPK